MDDNSGSARDDEREVPLDDETELELPPPTLDPQERIEDETDPLEEEERAAAREAGEAPD